MNNESIDKLAEVYATDEEDAKAYQKAQASVVVNLTRQNNDLRKKIEELSGQVEKLVLENTKLKAIAPDEDGLLVEGPGEEVCEAVAAVPLVHHERPCSPAPRAPDGGIGLFGEHRAVVVPVVGSGTIAVGGAFVPGNHLLRLDGRPHPFHVHEEIHANALLGGNRLVPTRKRLGLLTDGGGREERQRGDGKEPGNWTHREPRCKGGEAGGAHSRQRAVQSVACCQPSSVSR